MDVIAARRRILMNAPHIVTPTPAGLVNFSTDMKAPLKACKVHFAPVQEGTGDPSPENVRPISGWTGCKVWRTGKNLIDESYLANGNSYPNSGSYGYYNTDDIQLAPSTRYRFVWYDYDNTALTELGTRSINLYVSGASEYIVNNASYRQYSSGFITPATGIIRLGIYHPSSLQRQDVLDAIFNNGKLLLQVGTDDFTYTPYTGTTIPLDWTDSVGTVYGGYVDLVSGEVWAEYYKITLDGENVKANRAYKQNGNYGCGYVYVSPSGLSANYKNGVPTNIWCENVPLYIGVSAIPEPPYVYAPLAGELYLVMYFAKAADHPELADNTARINYGNEWLKSNPITVVYQLATPTLLTTLTPTTLRTLIGTNNIWSNANGDIDLSYWTH